MVKCNHSNFTIIDMLKDRSICTSGKNGHFALVRTFITPHFTDGPPFVLTDLCQQLPPLIAIC